MACGAPLADSPVNSANEESHGRHPVPAPPEEHALDAVEIGKKVEQGSYQALNLYSNFFRALADAAAISITSAAIGITGGVTGLPFWGVVLGTVLGLAVGLVRKSYLFTIFGAPIGFVAGALTGGLLWAGGLGQEWMVFAVGMGACAVALVGGRWTPMGLRSLWHKLRPLLGAAGGLVFAVLGALLGSGLQAAVDALFEMRLP